MDRLWDLEVGRVCLNFSILMWKQLWRTAGPDGHMVSLGGLGLRFGQACFDFGSYVR